MELQAFLNGGFQPKRFRPGGIGNWSGHLPFAADLIAAVKPVLLVELGTHYGESYFGFCQAVRENNIACSCYAVDTWVGEPHAGFYDESVYNEVNAYNSAHYADFSYLLRTTFDEAIAQFADESVDILHIDGLHTYDAVSHDLSSWLTKVKPGGIVMMHDVMARHADFGVWKLWDELGATGKRFVFTHSWGLGVFRKPGSEVPANGLFTILFDSPSETREHARKFYALCATKLEHEQEGANRHYAPEGKIVAHIYPFGDKGYAAENSIKVDLTPQRWEHVSVEILQSIGGGPLRIDPSEQPGLIDLAGIVLRRAADGEVMWSAKGSTELTALSTGGTLIRVETSESHDFCRFFSHGSDPQLFLPALERERFDQPLSLEIWLRVQNDMASLLPILQNVSNQQSRLQILESAFEQRAGADQTTFAEERSALLQERDKLLLERNALAEERNALLQERDKLLLERNTLAEERSATVRQQEALFADFRKLQSDLYVCKTDLKRKTGEEERVRSELAASHSELAAAQSVLHEALTSRSWRITSPIRKLSRAFGAQR